MQDTYIFEGKTSTEAIQKGLKELKIRKDEAEITVLKEEKRIFFSILEPRVVKVEFKLKENNEKPEKAHVKKERKPREKKEMSETAIEKATQNIENFLGTFLKQSSTEELKYTISDDKYYIYVNIEGEGTNFLIGYRGETLNALQTLISSIANKQIDEKVRVIVDISGYREKRKKVLEELAEKVSKTVVRTKKKVTLEPMSAYERKVIHSKLQNSHKVTTESVGDEPNRRVVIVLKK